MAAERNHLSLSMASTLASSQGSQQPQPTSHILQQQPTPNTGGIEGQDGSPGPAKRGPGRPKGSTKKSLDIEPSSPPKLKRPVGRPRKDGRPAGSVPKVSRGPGRPRKNFPPDFSVNTFPQQQQQGEQDGWAPLSSMFNNYRLPKEGVSDAAVPAAVNETINIERHNASSGAANDSSPAQQASKWFPTPPATTTATSSSSIANALTHPLSINQNHTTNNSTQNSVEISLTSTGNREYEKSVNNVSTVPRQIGHASPSIPISQIASFILVTIYSLFSRQSHRILPLPRDLLPAYRAHLGHLSGSQSVAYTYLTTFWLPCSPLLFRMVLPRSGATSKSSHRTLLTSNRPPPSSRGATNGSQHTNGTGDAQKTPNQDHHYESHRFFYWDPFHLSLTGPLTCPVCTRVQLNHSGSVRTGPLRVFDLSSSSTPTTSAHVHAGLVPSTFYVIGMQYECSDGACGTRLASWDPKIVNSLPPVIADELPVQLSSIQTEPNENRMGLSGDAVSRPLFALVKTLAQMGTSQEGIRNILSKMWDWSDCDKEDDREEESEDEDPAEQEDTNKTDNEKVVEMLFASPYQKLWTAQAAGASTGISLVNGQRPAKRHKPNEPAPGVSGLMPAPTTTNFSSGLFGSQTSAGTDGSSNGLAIQLHPPPDHRVNSSDNQNPQSQPQPSSRPQPPQPTLKPGQPMRPQPSPRTSLTHAHPSHIHTPSPIYPATSLPNSTTNSPQTGQGSTLALKRSIDLDQHHPPSGVGAPVSQAPAPATTQASSAQQQFTSLAHSSPFPHLRALQHHPTHPPPPPPHPHHHSAPVRAEPPLHIHPSLAHAPNPLARFNAQTLHPQQPMLAAAPQTVQHPAPTQRRVRHCVKCGRNDCKGKGGSQFCKNPCKDCSGMDCKGRNSKRPNATCREGW